MISTVRNISGQNGPAAFGKGLRIQRRRLFLAALAAGLPALAPAQTVSAQALYSYRLNRSSDAAGFGALAALAGKGIVLRGAQVVAAEQEQPLAQVAWADSPAGRVLLDWRALVDDPFLTLGVPADDLMQLAPVLQRHVDPGTPVLAWWDSSRQFRLLAGVDVMFGDYLGFPLFVPERWTARRAEVEAIERAFWQGEGAAAPQEGQGRFRRFVDALLAPAADGMAQLQELARSSKIILILHARDVILLGQLAPERIGVAFRDMGAPTDVHNIARSVRGWLVGNGYNAYTMLQGKSNALRALALTDEASGKTLAARLLPFIGNDQSDVPGATLVYRAGGFVVFEVAARQA